MQIVRTVKELRAVERGWHAKGDVIGIVPTMGALHEGHLSLVEAAQAQSDRVMVSIFVNPTQFNDPKDLQAYPRTEAADLEKLAPLDVDLVYMPSAEEMYAQGFATKVSVDGLTDCLCGASRPGHFDGVATVVSKLFLQTGANKAFFLAKKTFNNCKSFAVWWQISILILMLLAARQCANATGWPCLRAICD